MLQYHRVRQLLTPCVTTRAALLGDAEVLQHRLLAVLQHTALDGHTPVDLRDKSSRLALQEAYEVQFAAGTVRKHLNADDAQPSQKSAAVRRPSVASAEEAIAAMRSNCEEASPGSPVPAEEIMSTLHEAGLQDIAIIDMTASEGQRDCDYLVAASGRSRQHALAGAQAIRFMVKEARTLEGGSREVRIHHVGGVPWFSVASGAISVHCLSAEVREELALEELAPHVTAVTFWRPTGGRRLTLDSITAEGDRAADIPAWSAGEAER